MRPNLPLAAKLSAHEKRWRERSWRYFGMTVPGRMSWADWFFMRATLSTHQEQSNG